METSQLEIEYTDGVALVRLNNPPMGFMNAETVNQLMAFFAAAETDDAVRAVVLTGKLPDVFIRHYDVAEIEQSGRASAGVQRPAKPPAEGPLFPTDHLHLMMEASRLPIAAAINGLCMGAGYELALACDVRFAAHSDEVQIGLPEATIGILPAGGGTQRLTRLVGAGRAAELILTATVVDAETALNYGLVNHLARDVVKAAMEWAQKVAALHPVTVAHAKALIHRAASGGDLEAGLRDENLRIMDLISRPDVIELMAEYAASVSNPDTGH